MTRQKTCVKIAIVMLMTTLMLFLVPRSVDATTISFSTDQEGNALSAGDIITDQYDEWFDLTVYSRTRNGMVFDSDNPTGGDTDLQTPSLANIGNAQDESLGNLLIISEDGDSGDPDDDARGGALIFDFTGGSHNIDRFGFHLVDAEESEWFKVLLQRDSGHTGWLPLQGDDLEFGNNSINRISPYFASDHGWSGIDRAYVYFRGSAGIDNIVLGAAPVPEPATLVLFGSGLIGLAGLARKRLKKSKERSHLNATGTPG